MLFAEVSDLVWITVIGFVQVVTLAVVSAITMVVKEKFIDAPARAVIAAQVASAAWAVGEVKTTLETSTAENKQDMKDMAKVGKDTLHLCNSAMEEQKRIYMVKCEESARTDPTSVNIAEAKAAREAYEKHKNKQEAINAGK
jgi:beta-mannanase